MSNNKVIQEFKEYLQSLPEKFYADVCTDVQKEIENCICKILAEQELSVYVGLYSPREKLSIRSFECFLRDLTSSDNKYNMISYFCRSNKKVWELCHVKAEMLDETISSYLNYEDDYIHQKAEKCLDDALRKHILPAKIKNNVVESFDEDRIIDIISKNPHHSKMMVKVREKREIKRKMENELKSRIPEKAKFLYPAARSIKRHFVLHVGPTNSGKTYDALKEFRNAQKGVYLAPLRLLALEVYENSIENGVPCSMLTGEEENITEGATHMAQTIEMASMNTEYDVAVIDEAQMIADPQRGGAWTAAILGIYAKTVHICMAAHALPIVEKLIEYCDDEYVVVEHKRFTPLIMEKSEFQFPQDVKNGDALIVFSKYAVLTCAAELQDKGISCSVIYGALPYSVRQQETARFANGETKVVVATDAIGMGLNLPVRRIAFLETEKYDGTTRRLLHSEEVQQIAGRAGRKGKYDEGFCTADIGRRYIAKCLDAHIPNIEAARLSFPGVLVDITGKLSEIMERWLVTEHEDMFIKTDLTDILLLCRELEAETDDKKLIYAFCMMPFNQKDDEMHRLWRQLFFEVKKSGKINSLQYDFTVSDDFCAGLNNNDKLKLLETAYQKYDLLYHCITHYGDLETKSVEKKKILTEKEKLSTQINDILARQKLARKRCKGCGKTLPWKSQYGYCERCYNSIFRSRWDYDYWD